LLSLLGVVTNWLTGVMGQGNDLVLLERMNE